MKTECHCAQRIEVRSPPPAPPGALGHLRVLDLSRVLAGPWASQVLAELGLTGAEVAALRAAGVV
jgi:crotonobetainyl-CoA:carnitine CoA-transferase CaiB-like acyl-CoA transferase